MYVTVHQCKVADLQDGYLYFNYILLKILLYFTQVKL